MYSLFQQYGKREYESYGKPEWHQYHLCRTKYHAYCQRRKFLCLEQQSGNRVFKIGISNRYHHLHGDRHRIYRLHCNGQPHGNGECGSVGGHYREKHDLLGSERYAYCQRGRNLPVESGQHHCRHFGNTGHYIYLHGHSNRI
ncbi:MAG: hypothetical protein EBX39_09015 [Actinobacteria bacterium]|nr:hypothetical protein [Actinomycetota bacterium]